MQTPSIVSRRLLYPFGGPLWVTIRRHCAVEYCVALASDFLDEPPERLSKTLFLCASARQLFYQLELERLLNSLIRQGEYEMVDSQTQRAINCTIARQFDEERYAIELSDELSDLHRQDGGSSETVQPPLLWDGSVPPAYAFCSVCRIPYLSSHLHWCSACLHRVCYGCSVDNSCCMQSLLAPPQTKADCSAD